MRSGGALIAATMSCIAVAGVAAGQTPSASSTPDTAGPSWAVEASLSAYFAPQQDFLNPVVTADHRTLHLEARYNYETIGAASLWVGWNLAFGKGLSVDFTPMVGGVFGSLDAVAPGYEVTVSYRTLELYSASEYVFDVAGISGSFFYNWSQLTYSPWDWLQVGAALQRTKVYQTARDVQRGPLIGLTRKNVSLTVVVFNPDLKHPTTVVTLEVKL
jgi:hypothetical protein